MLAPHFVQNLQAFISFDPHLEQYKKSSLGKCFANYFFFAGLKNERLSVGFTFSKERK